jgi:hypothetical protein
MTHAELERILARCGDLEKDGASWRLKVAGHTLTVLIEPERLRLVVPLAEGLAPDDMARALAANFDRAQESRYATFEGVLVALYSHRLATLGETDLAEAVTQLVALADEPP